MRVTKETIMNSTHLKNTTKLSLLSAALISATISPINALAQTRTLEEVIVTAELVESNALSLPNSVTNRHRAN